jgi:hypothetical protein
MKTDILDMYDNLKRDYDSLLKELTISRAFETVINYIESDNESDMNKYVLDLIEILRDLQYKVQEEGEEN